jgi:hypothetical protein
MPARPLILAFSPAPLRCAEAKEKDMYAADWQGQNPAPFLLSSKSFFDFGERPGEGSDNAGLTINLAGQTGVRPCSPADKSIHARSAPHPGLLPGGKNRRQGEGKITRRRPINRTVLVYLKIPFF